MAGMSRCGLAAAILASCLAFKYHLTHSTNADALSSQSAFTLTEGPMFASGKGPFNTKGPSVISFDYKLTAVAPGKTGATDQLNIWTIFVDSGTRPALGITVDSALQRVTHYCCTPALFRDNACGPNVQIGGLIVHPTFASRPLPEAILGRLTLSTPTGSQLPPTGTVSISASGEVVEDGMQYALVTVCDAVGSGLGMPAIDISMDAEFKNPYGYLPGQVYGYLPFYGTLFVVYLLFAIIYGVIAVRKRQYLLLLQYAIMGVIACGVFEMALFFFTYNAKNETGIPTPCKICGPPTGDYITALVVAVLKRAVSRSLLLAVALGFGVVHPKLSRRATGMTIGMGFAYLVFAVIDDVSRETAYDAAPSVWELPVLFLDLCFVMGIYGGLQRLRKELRAAGQMAKLQLYNRLYAVLMANVAAWFVVILVQIATRFGGIPLHWSAYFLLFSFWDVLYLAVLIAIAVIWAPGESSFQYAWYAQSASNEAEAGDDIPSVAGSDAASNVTPVTPHAGNSGEHGDGDIELAPAGVSRSAAGNRHATASSTNKRPGGNAANNTGAYGDQDDEDDDTEISFEHVERQAPKAAFAIGADDLDDDEVDGAAASGATRPSSAQVVRAAPTSSSAASAGAGRSAAPTSATTKSAQSSSSGARGLAAQDAQESVDDEAIVVDVTAPSASTATTTSASSVPSAQALAPSTGALPAVSRTTGTSTSAPKIPLLAPPKGDAGASAASASGTT